MKRFHFNKTSVRIVMMIIISIAFGIGFAVLKVSDGEFIDMTALVISIVAFVFAAKTYFSIDSVNSITSMEGNVLENENYTVAYSEILSEYIDCTDKEQFTNKLFTTVMNDFELESDTCIEFADNIQNVIDNIIWFAYVDRESQEFIHFYEALKDRMERELDKYQKLSNGIQYTLSENVKLINYVFSYHLKMNESASNIANLEDIRGRMIRNPISQIIYYDYLGLYYRKKAADIIRCDIQYDEFSSEYMTAVINSEYSDMVKRNILILLKKAIICFRRAKDLAEEDTLWNGYLLYNYTRAKIMAYLIGAEESHDEIVRLLDEACKARYEMNFLYSSVSGVYLSSMLDEELMRAQKLKNEFSKIPIKQSV